MQFSATKEDTTKLVVSFKLHTELILEKLYTVGDIYQIVCSLAINTKVCSAWLYLSICAHFGDIYQIVDRLAVFTKLFYVLCMQ